MAGFYLHICKQSFVVIGVPSSRAAVLSGVPQGTVLGPFLFLIFINDLSADNKCTVRLYADDCALYLPVMNVNDAQTLQTGLDPVASW